MRENLLQKQRKYIGFDGVQLFLLLALFFVAMNFLNKSFYILLFAFCIFILFGKRLSVDDSCIILFVLSFNMAIFSPASRESFNMVLKCFVFSVSYLFGLSFMKKFNTNSECKKAEKQLYCIIIVFALGTFVHVLLNLISNYDSLERNTVDFWVDDIISATGQAAVACMPMAVAISILFSKSKIIFKIISFFMLFIILWYNLVIASRTIIMLMALTIIICLFFAYKNSNNKIKYARLVLYLFLIIALCLVLYSMDVFGIKTAVLNSNLYERFFGDYAMGMTEDSRLEKKLQYLSNFGENIFGGANLRKEYGYAHDIYLDTYDDAGIFAFILVIVYILIAVRRALSCIRDKNVSFNLRIIVLCFYFVSFVEFLIEPVFLGMMWYFASFCFIDGVMSKFLRYKYINNSCFINGDIDEKKH